MTQPNYFFDSIIFLLLFLLIFFSLFLTISQRNPMNAILFLIFFFFNIASLFVFCGVDYLGILFLMLYAGAISIILLFVVMFLNLKDILVYKIKKANLLLILLSLFFCSCLLLYLYFFFLDINLAFPIYEPPFNWAKILNYKSNIEVVGIVFFEYYLFQFLMLGLLLFLVMVFVICLIINSNLVAKKQEVSKQIFFDSFSKWSS